MRTHGWVGSPPTDDDEALARILETARAIVEEHHRPPRVAEVARDLGVSRGTVYRYVRDGDELLGELASRETGPFVEGLANYLQGETDPAQAVVRAVHYVIDRLPENIHLALTLTAPNSVNRAASITSAAAQAFGRQMLRAVDVDWEAAGFDERRFALLVEQMLRTVQSFVLDPGEPARHGSELREYLEIWLVPSVRAITRGSGAS